MRWLCYYLFCCFSFCVMFIFFFFKQKTAYEMRISDWSSDVCSSDLLKGLPITNAPHRLLFAVGAGNVLLAMLWWAAWLVATRWAPTSKIGRASCRERVCQYV